MLRLLSDKNLNGAIVSGLLERQPDLDLVRAEDMGLQEAEDPDLLEWAAAENRVLLSHDRRTMSKFVNERLQQGKAMPGVMLIHKMTVAKAIEEILIVAVCGDEDDVRDQVRFLPI